MPDPEIYTIATLTGHACIAFGTYSGIVANGPYHKAKLDLKLAEMGEMIGDQFDVSTLRREDYLFHMGKDEQSDILQVEYIEIYFSVLYTLYDFSAIMLRRRELHEVIKLQPLS